MTKTHDSATCTAGFNSRPCDMCQFAQEVEGNRSKSPSGASTTPQGDAGFLVPEAENVSNSLLAQSSPVLAPTFDQEWHDAPRWTTRYTELDRLRAVLFDVIDAGCNCGIQAGETGKHAPWAFDDDDEDFANEQRTQFVDEVIRRLQPSTQVAEYWFIRGQHAKEVELLAGMNADLREMIRVARERIGR